VGNAIPHGPCANHSHTSNFHDALSAPENSKVYHPAFRSACARIEPRVREKVAENFAFSLASGWAQHDFDFLQASHLRGGRIRPRQKPGSWIGGTRREDVMANPKIVRVQLAAFVVAVTLAASSLAFADDDDYYRRGNPQQAHQYGFQNGYQDGLRHGQHEARENDPNDFQSRDWRNASRGYQPWMGPFSAFQDGYRDGYRQGFQQAFNDRWGRRGDGDRDDYRAEGARWPGGNVAYNYGLEDGTVAGREDWARGKQFNPNPRGGNHADRGYSREYGNKDEYRVQYSDGYRAGYQRTYGRGY